MSHYIQTKFTRAHLPLSRVLKVPSDSRRGVRAVAVERDSSGSQFDWNLLLLQILRRRVAREHVGPSLGVRMSRAGEGPHCTPGFDLLSARPVSRENDLMGKVDIHLFSSSCLNQALQMQTGTGLAHRFQDGLNASRCACSFPARPLCRSQTQALTSTLPSQAISGRDNNDWIFPFSGEDWKTGVYIFGRLFSIFPLPSSHAISVSSGFFHIPHTGHNEVQGLGRASYSSGASHTCTRKVHKRKIRNAKICLSII